MSKLDRLGWVVCDWFEIEGYRFGVRSTSHAFGEWVRYGLEEYRVEGPEDEDQEPFWSVVVEDGSRGEGRVGKRFHIVYRGTWDVVRTLDVAAAARALLVEVESILFPLRDDAIFLEAGLVRSGDASVLVPHSMVPGLARAGRRAQRVNLQPPGTMAVAIDPDSGQLVPIRSRLRLPGDLDERLAQAFPPNGHDPRVFVEGATGVNAVLLYGGPVEESGIFEIPRAQALYELARSVRNLPQLGGRAIRGIARLLAGSRCVAASWRSTEQMLGTLASLASHNDTERRTQGAREGT
jgi:hypothetical protein